jgi:hypothetical protein
LPLKRRSILKFIDKIMGESLAKSFVNKWGRLALNFLTQQSIKIANDQSVVFFFDALKFLFNCLNDRQWDQLT